MKLSRHSSFLSALLVSVALLASACGGGQSGIFVTEVASDIIFGSAPLAKAPQPAPLPKPNFNFNFPFNLNFGFSFPSVLRAGNCPSATGNQAIQNASKLNVEAPPSPGSYPWMTTVKLTDSTGASQTASGFDQRQVQNVFDVASTPSQSGIVFTGNTRSILHYTYDFVQPTGNGGRLVTTYAVRNFSDVQSQYGTGQPGAPGNYPDADGGLALREQALYDASGKLVASFKPSTDLLLMPLPVSATGTPPNNPLSTPAGSVPANPAFAPGWSFAARDPNTGEAMQISGEILNTSPKTIDACGTLLDGFTVYTQVVSGNCPASVPTSTCLDTAGGAVPGTTAPCPPNLLCDEYDLVVDTGLGGLVIASDLSGSSPQPGTTIDDKEQIAGAPPATVDICPAAPANAKVVNPSGTDVSVQPGHSPIPAGGYSWLRQVALSDPNGATTDSSGLERHSVTNVSAVTVTPSNAYTASSNDPTGALPPAPQNIYSYSFDVVQPSPDGGRIVTSYVVHSFSDANYFAQNAPASVNAGTGQIVDADGGLSLHSRVIYDKTGKVVDSFQPSTDLLLLNLPVTVSGTPPEGPSPAQPGFSFVAQDPTTHMTVEMDVEVYGGINPSSPKPVIINACGGLVDGWQVFSQIKTAICSSNVSAQQCLNSGNATKNEYDYFVSTGFGGLITQSQLTGASSQGAGWTVNDFEHIASTAVTKG